VHTGTGPGLLHLHREESSDVRVSSNEYRVAVIGARRRRQGTGEYVAREFARCGCEVRAIVGTSQSTIELARAALRDRYGIECNGYTSLTDLLDAEQVDVVAVCSPPDAHLPQLELAARVGCHVFSEKPLWWSDELASTANGVRERTEQLLGSFLRHHRYLALNTQWPFTLDAFRRLHPQAVTAGKPPARFSMWLSPTSGGRQMLVDSAPHLLSMLYVLAGPGEIEQIHVDYADLSLDNERSTMRLSFIYRHAQGMTQVEFSLSRCAQPPRPAGYSVNGFGVQRHIELPSYLLSFSANGDSVPVPDPLAAAVADFVRSLRSGREPDRAQVVDGMMQLQQLVAATA
jgi:predicted dehydrogenase